MAQTLELVQEFHLDLPERIRSYLRDTRGISDSVIDQHLFGCAYQKLDRLVESAESCFRASGFSLRLRDVALRIARGVVN